MKRLRIDAEDAVMLARPEQFAAGDGQHPAARVAQSLTFGEQRLASSQLGFRSLAIRDVPLKDCQPTIRAGVDSIFDPLS
jgi:hypothetical protein